MPGRQSLETTSHAWRICFECKTCVLRDRRLGTVTATSSLYTACDCLHDPSSIVIFDMPRSPSQHLSSCYPFLSSPRQLVLSLCPNLDGNTACCLLKMPKSIQTCLLPLGSLLQELLPRLSIIPSLLEQCLWDWLRRRHICLMVVGG